MTLCTAKDVRFCEVYREQDDEYNVMAGENDTRHMFEEDERVGSAIVMIIRMFDSVIEVLDY